MEIFHLSGFPSNLIVTYLEFGVSMYIRHNLHGIVHFNFSSNLQNLQTWSCCLRSNSVLLKNLNVTCAVQVTLDS